MLNLMYCGNHKVFDGMLISLLSILKHTSEELRVYIITMNLLDIDEKYIAISQEQADYLEKVVRNKNAESRVILVNAGSKFRELMLSGINISTSYTPYTLLRLVTDELELPDKIIYLDTDTVANSSISSFHGIDIEKHELAAVVDFLGKTFIKKDYFNAGVLYLNMVEIRKTGLFKKARELCNTKKMSFPDQSALNKLAVRVRYMPERFNSQKYLYKDTVIRHFSKTIIWLPFFHTQNIKPWEVEKVRKIMKISAFDDVLDDYVNRKQILLKEAEGNAVWKQKK